MWHSRALEDSGSSGISRSEHQRELREMTVAAAGLAARHVSRYRKYELPPDAQECLWALEASSALTPAGTPGPGPDGDRMLSRREFELMHTQNALLVLRTHGLLLSLANQVLLAHPQDPVALATRQETRTELHREITRLEARSTLTPVPVRVMTGLQMSAIFACADALRSVGKNSI